MVFNEHQCMIDSYKLLTGKETYTQMLEHRENVYLVFNPSVPVIPMEDDVYDNVRKYFEDIED